MHDGQQDSQDDEHSSERRGASDLATEPAPRSGALFDGDLTDQGTLNRVLLRHGLRPNKGLGQHLLISRKALSAVVAAADLDPDDAVLEVGAGTGVLTRELAPRARRVVAIELDRAILPVLRETTAGLANVEIIPRNVLDVQPQEVFGDQAYKLVANLPYYITSLILRHLLDSENPPRLLVIMVQREVAERIVAGPGEMNLLGLSIQLYGVPRIMGYVPPTAFFPPPKVESAIIRIDLHQQPLLSGRARDDFFRLAHAGFAEKRKQLHNALERNLDAPRDDVTRWLEVAGVEPTRRAQTLGLDDWLRLASAMLDSQPAGALPADAEGQSRA